MNSASSTDEKSENRCVWSSAIRLWNTQPEAHARDPRAAEQQEDRHRQLDGRRADRHAMRPPARGRAVDVSPSEPVSSSKK